MAAFRRLSTCLVPALTCFFAVLAPAVAETNENQAFDAAVQSITLDELGRHVDVLADDSFEGRQAGSRGGRAAGGYLAKAMEQEGIQPAGEDGGYFQLFNSGSRNVLGMLEGRDEELKHEFVLIGAHYDHVGYGSARNSFGPTGYIHNGADDNASGTSGVLEVMQAFAALPQPPRRSILFAFWDGEEQGMLGSKHFVRYPTVPLKHIVLAMNSDMIGRLHNQRLEVYGSRTANGLRKLVSRENAGYGLSLDFIWDVTANSDHHPFFERSIPFLMFHTGLHDNYHRPSDDAHLINRQGMQAVSQLMFRVTHELADAPAVTPFRSQSRFESNHTRSQFERTLATTPPRLGVSWSREDGEPGLLLTRITPGGAAEQAGVQVGDRLLEFDGQPIEDGDHFQLLVLAADSETKTLVQRPGEEEPLEIPLLLRGSPMRIGISWDQDKATPSMVILTRVVPGSAAAQAGLTVHDRVYSIDGQPFGDGTEFGQQIVDRDGPLQLRVERQGVLSDVTLYPVGETAATAVEPAVSEPAPN